MKRTLWIAVMIVGCQPQEAGNKPSTEAALLGLTARVTSEANRTTRLGDDLDSLEHRQAAMARRQAKIEGRLDRMEYDLFRKEGAAAASAAERAKQGLKW